ncbi:MAG TPA: hypothetical protein VGC56_02740, partial [Allosphingosinicella sp.]
AYGSEAVAVAYAEPQTHHNHTHERRIEAIREARARGYEGDPCPECQNLTLVRNGTCLKCDTCGGTTGCS